VHLHTVELQHPAWALDLRDRYDHVLATGSNTLLNSYRKSTSDSSKTGRNVVSASSALKNGRDSPASITITLTKPYRADRTDSEPNPATTPHEPSTLREPRGSQPKRTHAPPRHAAQAFQRQDHEAQAR
jgi:hypothetical protein